MTKFAIGRWLRAADDLEPTVPVPASVVREFDELNERLDGAYAAEMHACEERDQAVKEAKQLRDERDDALAANLLLCVCAIPTVEPAGTPIGDQLATEEHCELCGNWMPAAELDRHMDRHDAETAPKAVAS